MAIPASNSGSAACPTCGGTGVTPGDSLAPTNGGKPTNQATKSLPSLAKTMGTTTVPNHAKGQIPAGLAAYNASRAKAGAVTDTRSVKQKLTDAQSRTNGGK